MGLLLRLLTGANLVGTVSSSDGPRLAVRQWRSSSDSPDFLVISAVSHGSTLGYCPLILTQPQAQAVRVPGSLTPVVDGKSLMQSEICTVNIVLPPLPTTFTFG